MLEDSGAGTAAGTGAAVGHVAVKLGVEGAVEVGYWTAAEARGRGLASRALEATVQWVFAGGTPAPVAQLDLLHSGGNDASCRVAERCGFAFAELLPARPPAFPGEGHRHVRRRPGRP